MTAQLDEIRRMVAGEPRFVGEPDLAGIRRRGRRLRARRRIVTGVAAAAVAAGVAVPVAALTTGTPDSAGPAGPATQPAPAPTATPTDTWAFAPVADLPSELPEGCGAFACLGDGSPETGEVVGEPWAVAAIPATESGLPMVDEVIYAVRPEPGERPVVAVGLRDGDDVRRVAILFRPGRDFRDTPLRVAGAVPRQGWEGTTYTVLGMVEGDPVTNVAWQTGPGPWDGAMMNDDLVPGYGVFWLVGQWDSAWPADGPAQVTVRVDGQEYAPPAP